MIEDCEHGIDPRHCTECQLWELSEEHDDLQKRFDELAKRAGQTRAEADRYRIERDKLKASMDDYQASMRETVAILRREKDNLLATIKGMRSNLSAILRSHGID